MSLGPATVNTMDLAAFRLDEIEADERPGVFRHARGLRARLARLTGRAAPDSQPEAEPDHFVWHSVEDLLRQQR